MTSYLAYRLSILLLIFSGLLNAQSGVMVERQTVLMGSIFDFTIVDKDSLTAHQNIDRCIAEIERIENLISEWRPQTIISQVNKNAGIQPVKVDDEVFKLTQRAIEYSIWSKGAFDISIIAMDKIWKFDNTMTTLPSPEEIANSVRFVGYQNIILDSIHSTVFLENKGMKIGFGSIGKAYAADKAKALMQRLGVEAGIINASGDIATWGSQPNGKPWAIGIRKPFKKHKIAKIINLKDTAVVTSGSYEKYAEIEEKRYSHIINPQTGMPASGLTSVTIYGPSAEFANALSTSIMVLGAKEGKRLMKRYPNYRYVFINDNGKIQF